MNNLLRNLKPYREGLGLLALGIVAFFIILGNPFNDFKLMTRGFTVQGLATDVNDFEEREDNGNVSRYFFIKYEFTTPASERISGVVEVPGNSTDKGFRTGQALDIQYLPEAPDIYRVKALASTTLNGWILKHLLFGLLGIAPGCYFLFRSWQTERKVRVKRTKAY
jgi:hypothetical protein